MKLLRHLSILSIIALLFSCGDDDEITDQLPPEDAFLYSFKQLVITDVQDVNGNTYISSGTLTVDPDISSEAAEGFSSQVIMQIVSIVDGEETEIDRSGAFNLSGSGTGDVQSFNLDFNEIVDAQSEVNIAANLLEAASGRKLKGEGILVNAEPSNEDAQISYKVKFIDWGTTVDNSNDGYFANRTVHFTVSTEGNVEKTLNGNIFLINDLTADTSLIMNTGDVEVKREGFSVDTIEFSVNLEDTLVRAGYEVLLRFTEAGGEEIVFEEIFKAANQVRIGFEPMEYDNREYTLRDEPTITFIDIDSLGYIDSVFMRFNVDANNDLEYGNSIDFELELPFIRVQYFSIYDSDFTEYVTLGTYEIPVDPFEQPSVYVSISEDLPGGDTATYDLRVQIVEPGQNFFNDTEDQVVAEYDKDEYPALGAVKFKL